MTKTTEQEKKKAKEKAEKTHIDTEITHILTKVPLKKSQTKAIICTQMTCKVKTKKSLTSHYPSTAGYRVYP